MFEIKKIPDDEYFSIGTVDILKSNELVVSNSWLKKVFNKGLYDTLISLDEVIDDDLQKIFDVGSGFHCYILERDEFEKRYYISDTSDPIEDRVRISTEDFQFIEGVHKSIKMKYPDILDGEDTELVILGEIDGVKTKSKIDKIVMYTNGRVDIIDLKSVYYDFMKMKKSSDGTHYKLRKQITDQDYDLQAYFYTRQVEEWLTGQSKNYDVSFSLLLASKETHDVKIYRLGIEMVESGRQKFDSVWGDIVNFVNTGANSVDRYDIL